MPDEADHLHDTSTDTRSGVPRGATQDESKGVPDAGRQQSETAPLHPEAGKDQAKDI